MQDSDPDSSQSWMLIFLGYYYLVNPSVSRKALDVSCVLLCTRIQVCFSLSCGSATGWDRSPSGASNRGRAYVQTLKKTAFSYCHVPANRTHKTLSVIQPSSPPTVLAPILHPHWCIFKAHKHRYALKLPISPFLLGFNPSPLSTEAHLGSFHSWPSTQVNSLTHFQAQNVNFSLS